MNSKRDIMDLTRTALIEQEFLVLQVSKRCQLAPRSWEGASKTVVTEVPERNHFYKKYLLYYYIIPILL